MVETKGQLAFTMPPHTISSLPVHTDGKFHRALGAEVSEIGLQLFVEGLYRAPLLNVLVPLKPPHTMNSLPLHTPAFAQRALGAPFRVIAVHVFVDGL